MKLQYFLNLKKLLTSKSKHDTDRTTIMKDKATVEETVFPKHIAERYVVRRSLGKGAFGIVYLAEDNKIGRLVAIKQLFKSYVKDSEIHKRFMQEARIGAQLDHPNIINVFGLEENNRSACIIMEYLGGGSLEAYMEKNHKIDQVMALHIFRGIMLGLNAAHKVKAIHRDIKPPNIIFDHLGEPKISDFGIAYLPVDAGGTPEINFEKPLHSIAGTPRYMSPEQISGASIDCRTDIYSAGAVLYEMLTGEKVFQFYKQMEFSDISKVILYHKPKKPSDIPEQISNMLMKLLKKNPDDRYQTAEEVILEIDNISSTHKEKTPEHMTRIGNSGPLLSSPVAIFEDVIRLLLVDGILAPSERRELNRRAERLGISDIQSNMIEEKVRKEQSLPALKSIKEYRSSVETFLSLNKELKLTADQKQLLKEKRNSLKIKREEASILESQAKEKIRLEKRRKQTG